MKSTKKAFLLSMVSMLLCVAMLMGTTFAWFTDTVTSGVNKIIAGNLDIELYHASKNVAKTKVTEATENLFKDVALWEPGAYAYETFTVANEGSLALKYSMALNVNAYTSFNGHNLTEVLKVAVMDGAPVSRDDVSVLTPYTLLKDWSLNKNDQILYPVSSPADTSKPSEATFTVVIYWEPTDHDNDFNMNNGRPQPLSIDLGVTLVATQATNETDSFNDQYDKDATNTLPEATKYEAKLAEAKSAKTTVSANGDTKIKAAATPTTSTIEGRQDTTVTFPKDALTANKDAVLSVKTTNTLFAVTSAGAQVASVDLNLTVDGQPVTNFNGKTVTVETYISAGLTNVRVTYNGTGDQPTDVVYDAATGKLTFKTTHFSEYTVSGKAIAYILGEKDTGFEGYDDAAEAAKEEGVQVELTKDADMKEAAEAAEEKGVSFVIPTQVVQEIEKGGEEDKKVQSNFSARVGTKYFGSVADAMEAAGDGDTVIVLNDCNIVGKYGKSYGETGYSEAAGDNRAIIDANGAKNLTLNLNGNTITGRLNFTHGDLTVKNGKWISSSQAINIFGSKNYNDRNTEYTVVTIEKDVEIVSDNYGVCVFGGKPDNTYWPLGFGEVINFYGKVTAPVGIGNSGNIGMDTYSGNLGKVQAIEDLVAASDCNSVSELMIKYGPVLNICDGAVVDASEQAIYWPGLGTINIKGGSVTGTEAIGIKGGIVNVSGGTLTANGPKCNPVQAINSGEEATGAAISVTTYYNANYPITVNVTGGTLESKNNVALLVAHSVKDGVSTKVAQGINLSVFGGTFIGASDLGSVYVEPVLEGEAGKYPTKFITGGTFSSDPKAYVADGYKADKNDDTWTVDYDGIGVAQVGETKYGSLENAIAAAPTGSTIKMLGNAAYTDVGFVLDGVNLDLNGYTVKFTRSAKSYPKSLSLKGNVTVFNGSVEGSLYGAGGGVIYAEQGSNVTLRDVNVKSYTTADPSVIAYGATVYGGYMDDPNGNMVIESGTFDCLVGTNGSTRGGSLTINGGTFNEYVYLPAYMTYTINGGTFNNGVEFDSGIISITGGTFNKGEEDYPVLLVAHNGPIDNSHDSGYGPTPVLDITGGTFNGKIGLERTDAGYAYPTVNKAAGITVETVALGVD